jgi:hypothetical protein
MRKIGMTGLFAAVIFGMPLLPLLAQGQSDHQAMQTQGDHQTMTGGMMGMMAEHQKQFETMSATLADMAKTIAAARKSNDASTLHKALDELQASVTKMEGQIKAGQGMMKQMMQMQGRGRMMNQPAPDAPH